MSRGNVVKDSILLSVEFACIITKNSPSEWRLGVQTLQVLRYLHQMSNVALNNAVFMSQCCLSSGRVSGPLDQ